MTLALSSNESRALSLLGSGVAPVQVAAALGITESAISQFLANEEFAKEVALKRYENLQAHSIRDGKLDGIEDTLIEKLKESMTFLMPTDSMKIARLLAIVNAAKRRGAAAPADSNIGARQIANITMPTVIKNLFVTNINNQVVVAGTQDLVTIQPKNLLDRIGRGTKDEDVNERRIAAGGRS